MVPNIAFRQGTEEDKSYVLSVWIRGLRKKRVGEYVSKFTGRTAIVEQGFFAAFMPHDLYFERFRPIIEGRVYPISNILVAYNTEFPDQIFGFIAYRHIGKISVISFCHVKEPFRKFGIARQLFETAQGQSNVATFHAPWLSTLFKKKGIIFDPFFDLLLSEKETP